MVACLEEIAFRMGYITAARSGAARAGRWSRARTASICSASSSRKPEPCAFVPTDAPGRPRHRARRAPRRRAASFSRPITPRSIRDAGIAGPFVQDNHSRSVGGHAARPAPAGPAPAGQAGSRHRGRDLRRRRRRAPRLADVRPLGRRRRCRPRTSASATSRRASRTASACSARRRAGRVQVHGPLRSRRARSASPGTTPRSASRGRSSDPLLSDRDTRHPAAVRGHANACPCLRQTQICKSRRQSRARGAPDSRREPAVFPMF